MIQLIFTLVGLFFIPFFWMSLSWALNQYRPVYSSKKDNHAPVKWNNDNHELKTLHAVEKSKVDMIAQMSELTPKDWQANIGMVSYMKDKIRINVYTTVMTVAIAEPGKKQRYLYNVDEEKLKEIFASPNLF